MGFYCTPVRMAKIKTYDHINVTWECGGTGTGTLIDYWWEYKMAQPFWKTVWQFLQMLNTYLPCESPISDCQRERKACVHTEICYADIYGSIIHISQRLETPKSVN